MNLYDRWNDKKTCREICLLIQDAIFLHGGAKIISLQSTKNDSPLKSSTGLKKFQNGWMRFFQSPITFFWLLQSIAYKTL